MSPPPCLCSLSVRMAVKCGICGDLDGVLGGEWARESGGGVGWTDELVYLVCVGG